MSGVFEGYSATLVASDRKRRPRRRTVAYVPAGPLPALHGFHPTLLESDRRARHALPPLPVPSEPTGPVPALHGYHPTLLISDPRHERPPLPIPDGDVGPLLVLYGFRPTLIESDRHHAQPRPALAALAASGDAAADTAGTAAGEALLRGFRPSLIESARQRKGVPRSVPIALLLHAAAIWLALMVPSTGGVGAGEGLKATEQLVYIAPDGAPVADAPPPIDAPPPPPTQEPEFGAAGDGSTDLDGAIYAGPALAKGFQILSAPIGVPDRLPEIDLSRAVTDEMDFSGRGVAGGVARGVVGGVVPTDSVPQLFSTVGPKARSAEAERVYFEFQVEKPVLRREGNPPPRYPEVMRNAGVEGEVMAQFVVDTTGRAVPGSLKILTSSHDMFSAAVRAVIPELRFYPAETGGRKVRMLVQQPYTFRMDASPSR